MSPADSSPGVNDNDEMIAAIIKQSGVDTRRRSAQRHLRMLICAGASASCNANTNICILRRLKVAVKVPPPPPTHCIICSDRVALVVQGHWLLFASHA